MDLVSWVYRLLGGFLISKSQLTAENLALRQQLGVLMVSGKRPRLRKRDRIFWIWLSKLWKDWRSCLVIVQPDTVVRWHRQGFRFYWRWKSRNAGRPKVDPEIRNLIRRMSSENPCTAACDFFVVPTATFRLLFCFVVLAHSRRRIAHFNVTTNRLARWAAQQIVEAFPADGSEPRYLLRDRDGIYGVLFHRRVKNMGIEQVLIAPRSPWQNPYAERVIGSIRRECLNHIIVLSEAHLRRVLKSYVSYYSASRPHMSLDGDAPFSRTVEPPSRGWVVAIPQVGGLHHRYMRAA